ncbi:hypothetical protein P3X46_003691 [Hevea brasiliensis]|uniref:Major facilitator superfamily (MFS) profile domain-containing protein n=1 Tax=Hevea brasiliensis TaxID=3981 RepID=A0ABQ9N8Q8_HEVBR|nr:hypothetical protein P3X46_003691 [Hevea brasiliensis]
MAIAFISGFSSSPFIQVTNHSDEKASKFLSTYPQQRSLGRCECSSYPSVCNWSRLKQRHWQHFEYVKVNRTCAYHKSEEYDITEAAVDSLKSAEGSIEAVLIEGNLQPCWQQFPKRWVIVLLCFMAFLSCNMDRVNMSIAILPMSQEFNWNSATVGLIQSSFFWGCLMTQAFGLIKLVESLLGFGVVWWSIATVLTPIAARIGLPFLLMMRAFMGIGERSRSLAFVYSGMYLGSVMGLAVSPILIHKFGWPSVFYSFGSQGSIWFALWLRKLSAQEKKLILGGSMSKEPVYVIPWKLILSKAPVWALIISYFCHNWGTFILLTWMPTYYNQFNLTESGLFCVFPWLTMALFANIGGSIADTLVSKCLSITTVRKGSDAFSQSGLYSNHQDIGPPYAGVLLGLSNTAGVLAGVFGTAATGCILQRGSWDDVFQVAVVFYIIGTLVWNIFSTGESSQLDRKSARMG